MKKLSSPHGKVYFSFKKTIWMYLMFSACLFIDFKAIGTFEILLSTLLTFISVGIGHSVTLHRGIIHKAYVAVPLFRKLGLFCTVLTGLGNPLSWLKQHYYRDYWQNRMDCPRYFRYQHSLLTDFWWNLHLQFLPTNIDRYQIPKSDLTDSTFLFFNKTWHLTYIAFGVLIWGLFDLNTALFVMCMRTSVIILGHWFIGYASHKFGYARHHIMNSDESGYNNLLLGILSFGEGFHNNHHTFPTSAKFSSKWYEVDMGWYIICVLKRMGLIVRPKNQSQSKKENAHRFEQTKWTFPWSNILKV